MIHFWHESYILFLWTEEKGGSAGRGLYHERSKEINLFLSNRNIQDGFWQWVGLSCWYEWIILSAEVNLCLLGKRIASYKFRFGRTCISITMKFINEVVNGGITIILFVVTNLVCVPIRKEKEFVHFSGSRGGMETHKNFWMEMEKGYNSAVECHLDMVEVISSSLIIPKPNVSFSIKRLVVLT